MMGCGKMVGQPKVPQVAGTYEGEMTTTVLLTLKLPTTATVTQSGADITVVLRFTVPGESSEDETLKGKIDKDGKVTLTEEAAVVEDLNRICGAVSSERQNLSFQDDEMHLTASAETEDCGPVTAKLVAKKT